MASRDSGRITAPVDCRLGCGLVGDVEGHGRETVVRTNRFVRPIGVAAA